MQHDGIEILAALPPDEAAPLTDMAVAWLGHEARFALLQAPEKLVKKLAEGQQSAAALRVARALFRLWDENGQIASLSGRHMYEHQLARFISTLTVACGEDALGLFMELLLQAAEITGWVQYDHYSSRPIADDEMANYDPYHALISAARRSAEMLVANDPARMRSVIRRRPSGMRFGSGARSCRAIGKKHSIEARQNSAIPTRGCNKCSPQKKVRSAARTSPPAPSQRSLRS